MLRQAPYFCTLYNGTDIEYRSELFRTPPPPPKKNTFNTEPAISIIKTGKAKTLKNTTKNIDLFSVLAVTNPIFRILGKY